MNIQKGTPLRLPNQLLQAKKFEIWTSGKIIESGNGIFQLWVEQENPSTIDKGIKMTVRAYDHEDTIRKYIKERFYFDVAYATSDRIIVGIIPQQSNIKNDSSYSGFVNFAPFLTRDFYNFEQTEPFCCSLFFDNNEQLTKISYSNGMNNTLIIFS